MFIGISKTPLIDRHMRLLQLLPKHNYHVLPAAVEAGFKYNTASKQGKSLLETALKRQASMQQEQAKKDAIANKIDTPTRITTIAEKLGMTREQIVFEYKKILLQDRDLPTKLKALKAPLKDEGIEIDTDEQNVVNVPILNVTVKQKKA